MPLWGSVKMAAAAEVLKCAGAARCTLGSRPLPIMLQNEGSNNTYLFVVFELQPHPFSRTLRTKPAEDWFAPYRNLVQ